MPCERWNEDWVALLYGEMEPDEKRDCTDHLAACENCRQTMDALRDSQQLLREGMPEVPGAPRLVVLRQASLRSSAWGFAAGLAAASVVFALALWASGRLPGAEPSEDGLRTLRSLPTLLAAMENRLIELEQRPSGDGLPADSLLTRDELRDEFERLRKQVDRNHANDMRYMIETMTASEQRTGSFMDRTQEAIQLLALSQDPRIYEK